MKFRAGYYGTGLSEEGHPVSYYEQNPDKNHWWQKDVEASVGDSYYYRGRLLVHE